MRKLVDGQGQPVNLGQKLGSGGEGDVFDVVGSPNVVAKVYHQTPDGEKQTKLRTMVHGCDDRLKKCAAWPVSTLHLVANGPAVGFLMPKVSGFEPIHKLYSPAHRKQLYPQKDWAFLVHVARNLAAAFSAVHARGHVIGDVNQGNVVVANNGVACLIDCDSFQIGNNGQTFLCEVGVPHFQPPELQSVRSFHDVRRTTNHDNFGLAILCFHLLFMGRHPFSGVYSGPGDMPIEKAIASYRFAFGASARSRGIQPPPNSVGLGIVPQQLAALFERAFSEQGTTNGRPTAYEWVAGLDYLRVNLRACPTESIHKFFGGLPGCPWCSLEQSAGLLFFIGVVSSSSQRVAFDLTTVWQRIASVPLPLERPLPTTAQFRVSARKLPASAIADRHLNLFKRVTAAVVVIGTLAIYPSAIPVTGVLALIIFLTSLTTPEEKKKRLFALNLAKKRWQEIERQWSYEVGGSRFDSRMNELRKTCSDYQQLDREYAAARQQLNATMRERQLRRFLEQIFIEAHEIPQIGPVRKATLASFGIETAADVAQSKISNISGFGAVLTGQLLQWRREWEQKFVFDPTKGINPADVAAVEQRFRQQKRQLEGILLAGAEGLTRLKNEAEMRARALWPQVQAAAQDLAQAKADVTIV